MTGLPSPCKFLVFPLSQKPTEIKEAIKLSFVTDCFIFEIEKPLKF